MYLTKPVNVSPEVPGLPDETTATDILEAGTQVSLMKRHIDDNGNTWKLIQHPPRHKVVDGTEVRFAWVRKEWLSLYSAPTPAKGSQYRHYKGNVYTVVSPDACPVALKQGEALTIKGIDFIAVSDIEAGSEVVLYGDGNKNWLRTLKEFNEPERFALIS